MSDHIFILFSNAKCGSVTLSRTKKLKSQIQRAHRNIKNKKKCMAIRMLCQSRIH